MSALLLDTHALLWWLFDSAELSKTARRLMAKRQTTLFVSSASLWEIAIKTRAGKLRGAEEYLKDPAAVHRQARLSELPISHAHAVLAGGLAWAHADPFDRMLVAQSRLEGCPLLTRDDDIRAYHDACRW
jgi:PIN domain nuclease of toxin-antitoxin system